MIIDVNNPPSSPDSSLDSDLSLAVDYIIADGSAQQVAPGDWVDLDPGIVTPSPEWGFSFQVIACDPMAPTCLLWNSGSMAYEPSQVSPSVITNNFRHVPRS